LVVTAVVICFAAPNTASGRSFVGRVNAWNANQRALRAANPNNIKAWNPRHVQTAMKSAYGVYKSPTATTGQKRKALHLMRKAYFGGLIASTHFKAGDDGRLHPNFNSSALLKSTMYSLVRAKAVRRRAGVPLKLLTTRQPVDSAQTAKRTKSVSAALSYINGLLSDVKPKYREVQRIDAERAKQGLGPRPNEIVIRASPKEALEIARRRNVPGAPGWCARVVIVPGAGPVRRTTPTTLGRGRLEWSKRQLQRRIVLQ
jgi:hypothetical protein